MVVEEIEASSTTLTARGALLRLHALFAPVAAVSLAVVAQGAPRALGLIVCALLAAWHLGVVAIAVAWDDAQLWAACLGLGLGLRLRLGSRPLIITPTLTLQL